MTRNQKLLLKLMEECDEVSQRASKQILYGKNEVQDGQSLTNQQRLEGELQDLFIIIAMLVENEEIADASFGIDIDNRVSIDVKRAKVERYLDLSDKLEAQP